jgi:radical SAM superfamily enzyme YgiQ (UPF0313 family)
MLLIYPPVAKPCEPPAGLARLAGALACHDISCKLVDTNLEGLLYLLEQPACAADTWTRRAVKNRSKNISALRDGRTYVQIDRYSRAVNDLARGLGAVGRERGVTAGLADYDDSDLSPVRSADLIAASEHPEKNIFHPYFGNRLRELLEDRNNSLSIVGFSLNYLSQALSTFSMIGFVRKNFPWIRIVVGGGLATSWMKRPGWKNPFQGLVDDFVAGPGEIPLLRMLGIRDVQNRNAVPDYESLPINDYLSPGFILPYSGSTGCYWNKCSFCPERAEGNPYVPLSIQQVKADLGALIKRTRPALIHLLDNAVSPALLRALAKEPVGAQWYGFARFNSQLADLDFCMELRRRGCVMLKLGLESGDQGVLDRMQKGIDLRTASRILINLEKAGIAAYVYLLFGTPEETAAEARKTLAFVEQHREAVSFLNLAIFNMPVCSPEAEEHGTGQFYEGDLSLYTAFRHPRGWDRKQVRQFLDSEFKRNRAISSILRNDPPVFTSNHASFFAPGNRSASFKSNP